jgi:GDP-4-dehydro-6-deoxy-D-mannose reductase
MGLPNGENTLKALITGISGFVGAHLTEYLLRETDCAVAGTVFGPLDSIAHLRDRLQLYPAELSNLDVVSFILDDCKPDLIFHLAAQPLPALSLKDPWYTLENNIRMQLNILEAVNRLKLPARVLVVGSSEEYGMIRPRDLPISEEAPLRPTNPYAVSKVTQDLLGLQYHLMYGLHAVRVRPFNHIGPGQRLGFVVPDLAKQVAEAEAGQRDRVIRVGNLDVSRDFTDVRDVVRAYYMALTHGRAGEAYNIGSGRARTIRSVMDGLLALSQAPLEYQEDAERIRAIDVPFIQADYAKFHAATGWEPQVPFEQSLEDILNYWRAKVAA